MTTVDEVNTNKNKGTRLIFFRSVLLDYFTAELHEKTDTCKLLNKIVRLLTYVYVNEQLGPFFCFSPLSSVVQL